MPEFVPSVPAAEWHLGDRGRALGEMLADKLAAYSLDVVVSSTEPKAVETAQIVAHRLGIPIETDRGLHEHDRRNVPFMSPEVLEEKVAEFFAKPNELVFGSETAGQAHARFAAAIARVLEKYARISVAVVAHGTVISLFAARVANVDQFLFWKRLGLPSFVVFSLPTVTIEEVVENVQ